MRRDILLLNSISIFKVNKNKLLYIYVNLGLIFVFSVIYWLYGTPEHLTLIVDNYIASLVKKVIESDDIKKDLRDAKIKKLLI